MVCCAHAICLLLPVSHRHSFNLANFRRSTEDIGVVEEAANNVVKLFVAERD